MSAIEVASGVVVVVVMMGTRGGAGVRGMSSREPIVVAVMGVGVGVVGLSSERSIRRSSLWWDKEDILDLRC